MRVEVHGKNFDISEALRVHVTKRLEYALNRFDTRIKVVRVRLEDINGPRGGVDKQCRIEVTGVRNLTSIVEQNDHDLYLAIDKAADRIGQTVARAVDKIRDAEVSAREAYSGEPFDNVQ
ncbi:MAG: ribosome-associated translation inhibitor RaiA [Candidatus Riflebacteria bacterium]|nr:ribosome-associated translation inhibitor RaiA [Candidatus Riflebacteria bacterium]